MNAHESPLRAYRQREGISLKQFADLFGVNKTTVLRWEEGRLPPERASALRDATGIPLHELRPDIFPAPMEAAQ